MTEVIAKLNRLRIAPRKMRLLADLIRGKQTTKAVALLEFSLKRGALPLKKLLNSAVANAKQNFQLDEKYLVIAKLTVDEGSKLKRWRARAKGRANRIEKETSHITIVLETSQRMAFSAGAKTAPKTVALVEKKETAGRGRKEKTFKPERESKVKSASFGNRVFRRKSI